MRTAIVEQELIGGECSFYACMPSKALLRPGELLDEVARVPGVAELVSGELDPRPVLARRDEVIHELDDSGMIPWLDRRGIELIRGRAALDGERTVIVGPDRLTATKAVIIATGTTAAIPPIDGLAEARPWTNREATTASEVPGRLLILGGGVVGVEMAQAWASLGASVTLVEALDRVLANEEPFASAEVTAGLAAVGVEVRTGVKAIGASSGEAGQVSLQLEGGEELRGDELLVAVGRRPRTAELGLESVGRRGRRLHRGRRLDAGRRLGLAVRDRRRQRALAAHAHGQVPGADLRRSDRRQGGDRLRGPARLAAGGVHRAAGRRGRLDARAGDGARDRGAGGRRPDLRQRRRQLHRAQRRRGPRGWWSTPTREVVVGATFVGPEIAESLHAASIAVAGEVPISRLVHAVPAFPTRSEVWLYLLESYGA